MEIKRIDHLNEKQINEINYLFDDSTIWDNEQGDLFLKNKDNLLLLAYEGPKSIGFLTAHRLQRFDNRKAEVLLYEINVDASFRRKGIGRSLINECKNWAKEVGADEVWVLTENHNLPAMAMYESTGGKEESPGTVMWVYKI